LAGFKGHSSAAFLYIHTTHGLSPKGYQRYLSFTETIFYQNDIVMRNTADVVSGSPIAIRSQSISGGNVVNPLVAFYDIHGRKREVLFYSSVPDTTHTGNSVLFYLYLNYFYLIYTFSYFPFQTKVVWKRSLFNDKTAHCTFAGMIL
jgi:hypothetical protein